MGRIRLRGDIAGVPRREPGLGMGHTRLGRGEEEDMYPVLRTQALTRQGLALVPEVNLEAIEVGSKDKGKDKEGQYKDRDSKGRGRGTRAERRAEKDSSSRMGVQMGMLMKTAM